MPEIPDITGVLLSLFIIGVVSSGLTEILKLVCKRLKTPKKDPTWWQVTFRVIPICIGTAMGHYFFLFPWGVSIGATSGILSVLLYRKTREFLRTMVNPLNKG